MLQKALQMSEDMRFIVVVNKVDKPTRRAPGEVENEIFDLFVALDANDRQLDYPTLYASGKHGWCVVKGRIIAYFPGHWSGVMRAF